MNPIDIATANPIDIAYLIAYLSAAGAVIAAVWRIAFAWIRSLDGADTYRAAYTYRRTDPGPRLRASMLRKRYAR